MPVNAEMSNLIVGWELKADFLFRRDKNVSDSINNYNFLSISGRYWQFD